MRAFLQKFRSSTSSKSTSSAYAPPSKELEKEKKFPPLPEWPPPSLNNLGVKEPITIKDPISVPPTVTLTLSTNTPLTTGTLVPTTDSARASPAPAADTVPSSVTAPLEAKSDERTRKRASTATNGTATQENSKKITLTKDSITGFGRNTPTPPGTSTSNPPNPLSKSTTAAAETSFAPGANIDDRRKAASPSNNAPNKAKAVALHEARGSTSSNNTMGTIRTYTAGAAKNPSTRALASSPTPSSAANHTSVIQHRHPRHGRYNTMGLPMADNVSLLRAGTPMSMRSARTGVLTTASWSEAAQEDLVSNLGQRERTRQEVLWEIVASEQRCVLQFITSNTNDQMSNFSFFSLQICARTYENERNLY